jgi:hypothetical protein
MAASPHSWDFLLLRLRELRLPLLRGSASRTPEPTAKSIADILPRGGWQSKILLQRIASYSWRCSGSFAEAEL